MNRTLKTFWTAHRFTAHCIEILLQVVSLFVIGWIMQVRGEYELESGLILSIAIVTFAQRY